MSKLTAFTFCSDVPKQKQYLFVNACTKCGTNASTSCENVVKIGSVILEFKRGVCGIFAKTGQNLHIPPYILASTGPIFTDLSALVVIYVGIVKLALVLQSLKKH